MTANPNCKKMEYYLVPGMPEGTAPGQYWEILKTDKSLEAEDYIKNVSYALFANPKGEKIITASIEIDKETHASIPMARMGSGNKDLVLVLTTKDDEKAVCALKRVMPYLPTERESEEDLEDPPVQSSDEPIEKLSLSVKDLVWYEYID